MTRAIGHHDDVRSFLVTAGEAGLRLDRFLASRIADVSRSRLQALIREGNVTCGGAAVRDPGRSLKLGETFALLMPPAVAAEPQGEAIALDVVYEDDELIVIDKPAGLVVHPAAGHQTGTLVNALIAHCGESLSGIGGVKRPGIVHRLDKDTSGLLVVAKTDRAHHRLAAQFAAHGSDGKLLREYKALVWGIPEHQTGVVRTQLGRSSANRIKIAVVRSGGREAVTHYRVERVLPSREKPVMALVACRLETGRTHQIRVHMKHIGHPLVGDATYGAGFATRASKLSAAGKSALSRLGRQALHAAVLGFVHPVSRRQLRFESPLPPDMAELIEAAANDV